jgi:hypothetical protein
MDIPVITWISENSRFRNGDILKLKNPIRLTTA